MMEADVASSRGPFRSQFVRESEARQAIYRRKFDTELQNWLREIRDEAFIEFKSGYGADSES